MAALLLFLFLLPAIFFLGLTSQHQQTHHHHHHHHHQDHNHNGNNNTVLITQLHEARLKHALLESALEEVNQNVNTRDLYLLDCDRRIAHIDNQLNRLRSNFKSADEKIIALEEQERILWATLRKNNFELHVLESKAREAEERLQLVTSQVQKMEEIVTEQWIQIQQFEQALLLGEMRLLKAQRHVRSSRCTFLKFMNDLSRKYLLKDLGLFGSHFSGKLSALSSYVSQALDQLERLYSSVKEFHHELQGFFKQEMERHEFTANLSNRELIFFVASALIVYPALMLFSSLLHFILV